MPAWTNLFMHIFLLLEIQINLLWSESTRIEVILTCGAQTVSTVHVYSNIITERLLECRVLNLFTYPQSSGFFILQILSDYSCLFVCFFSQNNMVVL